MSKKRKNAGEGYGYMFSGAFKKKSDAEKKERSRKGAFIKGVYVNGQHRYAVLTPRLNPVKRRRKNESSHEGTETSTSTGGGYGAETGGAATGGASTSTGGAAGGGTTTITISGDASSRARTNPRRRKNKSLAHITINSGGRSGDSRAMSERAESGMAPNPTELLVMGANPQPREIVIPPNSTITIRTNPARANWMGSARSAIRHTRESQAEERFQEHMRSRKRVAFAAQPKARKRFKWERGSKPAENPVCGAMIGGYPCSRKPGHRGPHLPQGATMRPKSRLRRGWNPSAAAIHDRFTGKEGKWLTIHDEPHMPAGDYAQLGELLALYFKPNSGGQVQQITFPKADRPLVVSDETSRQIYFVGGNQSLLFRAGELGECRRIDYKQRKEHVPDPDADEWRHAFGEESGVRPVLIYDARNKRLLLEGGEYRIESAGIIN